ncbi:type I-B CRISPR-associated protein Cas7/Csh2 [Natrinema sp. 1APR25-10V2]|uniref:type I-B CRISPR-associated protein Cas7/Csh2 n=1 Tax=Natrinema sp. 1APR25-10V2 TaxID=2951081 RepID=UPI0028759675|nr:type I-B CRISPR-associated protein Cas7/Csh2 [Natrinema sp. 1APR25-10V2]MDS0474040.1 type I-B CRISPR-associated protein Cas7/Csh2 [Natrinema sp. 1APR25-10V2]
MSTNESTPVENRSEIVFVTDAQDCNPNGNPSDDNRPRIDRHTGTCSITDVCLKQYIRRQLLSDGHDVYVRKPQEQDRGAKPRWELALDILGDVESPEDVPEMEEAHDQFFSTATDARYFGAAFTFKANEGELVDALTEAFPDNQKGPVQFMPARSLNEVQTNDELSNLTSVIATSDEKDTGGFQLDDYRIKYGIFPFYALIDEENGQAVDLSQEDVKRLDSLCWRAVKNQTDSRAKLGQEPRLYVRVEYSDDHYHLGNLHRTLDLDSDRSEPDEQMRDVFDVTLDVSRFIQDLEHGADAIEKVRVCGDRQLDISDGGGEVLGTAADLPTILNERLPETVTVEHIAIMEEAHETAP